VLCQRSWVVLLAVPASLGAEAAVAADNGAFARAVHGQSIEQANRSEDPVYLATLAAYDREATVLGAKPLKSVDENVYPGRVHERDL
jgi:hypothetical protein